MAKWIKIIPANQGGGRKSTEPTAKISEAGQLHMSQAAARLLGEPRRVRVEIQPDSQLVRMYPGTPDDGGAFSLSGGGNSPYRIHCRALVRDHPQMAGQYIASKINGGIELRKQTA